MFVRHSLNYPDRNALSHHFRRQSSAAPVLNLGSVIDPGESEMRITSATIAAGRMKDFSLNGDAITHIDSMIW
jgi:hypothetical protein